jgi:hypothetical protein
LVVIDRQRENGALSDPAPRRRQRVPLRAKPPDAQTSQVNVLGSRTGTSFTVDHVVSAPRLKSAQVAGSTSRVDGRFMVAHHDNFETGSSQFLYQVFDPKAA